MWIVDLIAVVVIVGLAGWGFRTGFANTAAVAAFAAGAVVGVTVVPLALHEGQESQWALAVGLPAALLVGGFLAAIVERVLGRRGHRLYRRAPVDALAGALVAAAIGAAAVWLLAAIVVQAGSLRDPVEDSVIVGRLDDALRPPGPGPAAHLPRDTFPIVEGVGPPIAAVDPTLVGEPRVVAADRSVVKVVQSGCGQGGQGSGWIGADGVVVTNAHVASRARVMTVRVGGKGPSHAATPIWFDPVNDIALLRVPALKGVPALPIIQRPARGAPGVELGFPKGRHAIRPARLGPTSSRNAGRMQGDLPPGFPRRLYGRLITSFRGRPQPGSSGGPIVDARGRVLTTVFGGRTGRRSGLGVPNRFVRSALRRAGPEVSTGPCHGPDDSGDQ